MNGYRDSECITIEFLQTRNISNYWGTIVIVIILLSIVLTWYLIDSNEILKWIVTICLALVGLFIIYSMYTTQRYFFKHGFVC